jgi:hypothetical protein
MLGAKKTITSCTKDLFWKKNCHFTSFHSTQRREKPLHPTQETTLWKKKGKEKKPQPFILRNPFEEIKKLNNQPSLSLYFHLMTLSHPTWPNCKRPVHFFPLYFGDASQPQFSWEEDFFLIFWKDLPVWWGPSGFWKLLSSLENNFQRPKVLIISLFFFSF